MSQDWDAIVVGAGPNGLVAAATLARQGWRVLLLEAKNRPGGALYSEELTLPGFLHDVGAAFFPFADDSPAFRYLQLNETGLEWRNAPFESCHPAPDGSCASISLDIQRSVKSFGTDGAAWRRLAEWQQAMGDRLATALLAPLPAIGSAWKLGISHLARLGFYGLQTAAAWAQRYFQTEAARRIIPALALHVDLGPNDLTSAGLGLVLALLAAQSGFRVPVGGARAIAHALIRRFEEHGGTIQLNSRVNEILVRGHKVEAVRTSRGDEIPVRHAVLADVGAPALFLKLLDQRWTSSWLQRSMRKFRYGWGTFKMDWALAGPVPWTAPEARESAVVHAGDSLADLIAFTQEVRAGRLPTNPYLVIGQQSLVDPSRAPPPVPPPPLGGVGMGVRGQGTGTGAQTLWAYSHVPNTMDGGWRQHRDRFADRIEQRIEGLAPGFRSLIRARAIHSPADLEAMDENLVGGDLGGGSARLTQQLFFRPAFPYFRYRTPVRGLYLASASTHPGAGVHGACGFNAAQMAIRDRTDNL